MRIYLTFCLSLCSRSRLRFWPCALAIIPRHDLIEYRFVDLIWRVIRGMKYLTSVFVFIFFALQLNAPLYAETAEPQEEPPGKSIPLLGNKHIPSLKSAHEPYNSKPPTSGPHTHNVAKWGVYRRQIPNELQVHNLEDGGVLIQYDCQNCKDLIKKIEKLAWGYLKKAKAEDKKTGKRSRYGHLIVAPYRNIGSKNALTAWGRIDKFDAYDDARIRRFIEAYIGVDHHPKPRG